MRPRWDGDTRGQRIGDARALVAGGEELLTAMREVNWIAEEPEKHLLPHIEAACSEADSALALERSQVLGDGSLLVDLRWKSEPGDPGGVRAAAYALIGSMAESASYIRQERDGDALVYDVVTGMLGDSAFAPHGHVVRLRIGSVNY
jgi:hypothetical protein